MRIIKEALLVAAGREHPPAARHLNVWRKTVKAATWRNPVDVRRSHPETDAVKVRGGRTVLVFNILRNDHRLIAAAHFNRQIVHALRFMTHADYSKERWKETS